MKLLEILGRKSNDDFTKFCLALDYVGLGVVVRNMLITPGIYMLYMSLETKIITGRFMAPLTVTIYYAFKSFGSHYSQLLQYFLMI